MAGNVMRVSWSLLSCVLVAGCGGHSLDIGSNDGGVVADVAPLPMLPLGPAPDAGDTRQVWIGHLDKDQFPDGSNTLTMRIDFAPGGNVTGSIVLGDGPLLAPPTDPNVGYPPGNTGVVTLVEGFPYTIQYGILTASHVALLFLEYEVWTQWCALQTSYSIPTCTGNAIDCPDAGPSGYYDCVPHDGSEFGFGPTGCGLWDPDAGVELTIDCGKYILCGGNGVTVCQCSATACSMWSSTSPIASLDLVLAGTKATGTLSGLAGNEAVEFTRSQ
jgi:hypothetical protein